jgi:hypothetical protein
MERFLLLWDELDDLAGAARHVTLNAVDGLQDAGRGALGQLGGWVGAANLRLRLALSGSPEG